MQPFKFQKYQGTGNDFILIDNRLLPFKKGNKAFIRQLCHRSLGVGADGIILLEDDDDVDFKMVYFNADGSLGSMCGNGGRCIVAFAQSLGIITDQTTFRAFDGLHTGQILPNHDIRLSLNDVDQIEKATDYYFLDTGSPHYVTFVDDLKKVDIIKEGKAIRYGKAFQPGGTNVNFVQTTPEGITVATYERGVEDETLSCGTGVTASAIVYALQFKDSKKQKIQIQTKGGPLTVEFTIEGKRITDIFLTGGVSNVFESYVL